MEPRGGRFHIYLQSNFKDLRGNVSRRRFSWAHEIAHTLFFEHRNGDLKPRRDAPRGEALEAACHRAASMILVPPKALTGELHGQKLDSAARVGQLAERFAVSPEVMLRRLNDLSLLEETWTPVLTRQQGPELIVDFAGYPVWLKPYLSIPKRGESFSAWFRATRETNGVLQKQIGDICIQASPIEITRSLTVFELRLQLFPSLRQAVEKV